MSIIVIARFQVFPRFSSLNWLFGATIMDEFNPKWYGDVGNIDTDCLYTWLGYVNSA